VELCFAVGVPYDHGRREAELRKLAWMALVFLMASFPLYAQQPQPSEETTPPEQKSSALGKDINQLKGDRLGESLDSFKTNHPKAQCKKRDSALTDCHVWDEVSIAGVSARGVEKCSSEAPDSPPAMNCLQGIEAHFVSELLAGLSYLLEGDDGSKGLIVSAFKQQYGPPTSEGQDQVMWSNDDLILSITLLKPNSKTSYIAVTLDLKPSEVGEDI
jgi:hypothetical protein